MTIYQVNVDDQADGDFKRVISIKQGKIDIDDWVNSTLNESDQNEWRRVKKLHENVVDQAVEAGICIREDVGTKESKIKWASGDIHTQWFLDRMNTKDHEKYLSYWERYRNSSK